MDGVGMMSWEGEIGFENDPLELLRASKFKRLEIFLIIFIQFYFFFLMPDSI